MITYVAAFIHRSPNKNEDKEKMACRKQTGITR